MSCERCSDLVRKLFMSAGNCALSGGDVYEAPFATSERKMRGTQVPYGSHFKVSPKIPHARVNQEEKDLKNFLGSYPAPGL